jgi:hypothetical protein
MKLSRSVIIRTFYIIGAILIVPILLYYLGINSLLPQQIYIQVYLTGPLLIILGLLLFFLYRKRLTGAVFFIIGLWWAINIIYELAGK